MQAASPLQVSAVPARWSLGIGLVAAAHFANDAVTSMFPALLPSLAGRFQLDASELALLAGAFAVSSSLPQPLFGLLADRLGRHRVGALGLVVSAALVAGLGWVSSAVGLCVALVLGGLGSSAVHPAGMGLARASSSGNPGLGVAIFSSAGMAGAALGPVLAIGVASAWGLDRVGWAALPVLLVAVLLAILAPRPRVTAARAPAIRQAVGLIQGPVAWLAFVALFANVVMLTFNSALPLWLVAERGLSETSPVIGLTLATFALAAAVGGILGGVLARRFSPRRLIAGSLAAAAIALEGVLLATPGSAPYVLAVAAAGALLGLHGPLLIAKAQELTPGAESAVSGVLLGATSAAAGLIYAGFGALQSALGIGGVLAAASLLLLPAAHLAATTLERRASPKAPCPCRHAGCCAALGAAA